MGGAYTQLDPVAWSLIADEPLIWEAVPEEMYRVVADSNATMPAYGSDGHFTEILSHDIVQQKATAWDDAVVYPPEGNMEADTWYPGVDVHPTNLGEFDYVITEGRGGPVREIFEVKLSPHYDYPRRQVRDTLDAVRRSPVVDGIGYNLAPEQFSDPVMITTIGPGDGDRWYDITLPWDSDEIRQAYRCWDAWSDGPISSP